MIFMDIKLGDNCLKEVANVISNCAKDSSNLVARYGGEEFVVVLPNTNSEKAYTIAEEIRKKVEEVAIPHSFSTVSNYVTISLGIHSVVPSNRLYIEDFIGKADKALYQAKQNNRNSIITA